MTGVRIIKITQSLVIAVLVAAATLFPMQASAANYNAIPLPIIIGSVIGLAVVIGLIVLLIVRSKRQKGSIKLGK